MTSEEIIKKHAPDWNRWHEDCRKQVLEAMEEYKTGGHVPDDFHGRFLNGIYD